MKKKSVHSETDSLSSSHTLEDMKEKSKIWTEEEIELLRMLLKNYGTDFHILSTFFPKKTKNQIKVIEIIPQNKYKQLANMRKKEERAEELKLRAVINLFKEVEEKEEENWLSKPNSNYTIIASCAWQLSLPFLAN